MFNQVIQGKTKDAAGLRRQFDRWQEQLAPGATGYLGSTGGVAEDGTVILVARFEDEQAARANSERPEQGAWWNETEKFFDGAVTFRDCADVDVIFSGGSDDAGFVQVMQGRVGSADRERMNALEDKMMPKLRELRSDVLGSVRSWDGEVFTNLIYFTSEEAARAGEAKVGEDAGAEMGDMMSAVQDLTFIDLKDPWLHSA